MQIRHVLTLIFLFTKISNLPLTITTEAVLVNEINADEADVTSHPASSTEVLIAPTGVEAPRNGQFQEPFPLKVRPATFPGNDWQFHSGLQLKKLKLVSINGEGKNSGHWNQSFALLSKNPPDIFSLPSDSYRGSLPKTLHKLPPEEKRVAISKNGLARTESKTGTANSTASSFSRGKEKKKSAEKAGRRRSGESKLFDGSVRGGTRERLGSSDGDWKEGPSRRRTSPHSCTICDKYSEEEEEEGAEGGMAGKPGKPGKPGIPAPPNPKSRHPNFMNSIPAHVLRPDHSSRPSQSTNAPRQSSQPISRTQNSPKDTSTNGQEIIGQGEGSDDVGGGLAPDQDLDPPTLSRNQSRGRQDPLYGDKSALECACDTAECTSNGQLTCTTFGSCYTQRLSGADGASTSIIRGCISTSTPLLCENRRPKLVTRWPHLNCCHLSMCNMNLPLGKNMRSGFLRPRPGASPASPSPPSPRLGGYQGPLFTSLALLALAQAEDERKGRENGSSQSVEVAGRDATGGSPGHPFPPQPFLSYLTTGSAKDQVRTDLVGERARGKSHDTRPLPVSSTGEPWRRADYESVGSRSVERGSLYQKYPKSLYPKISPLAAIFLLGGATLIVVISTISYVILKKEESVGWRSGEYQDSYHSDTDNELGEGKPEWPCLLCEDSPDKDHVSSPSLPHGNLGLYGSTQSPQESTPATWSSEQEGFSRETFVIQDG